MKVYETHGYVEPTDRGWRVTNQAAVKFGSDNAASNSDSNDEEIEDADAGIEELGPLQMKRP